MTGNSVDNYIGHYVLDGRIPRQVPFHEWSAWFDGGPNRQVAWDRFGDVVVSTVFLGVDHAFDRKDPPLIFETMIFGGAEDGALWRYSAWEEAESGHHTALALARSKL